MDSFDEKDENESGSVWTSYSDMFTTVAIIFLVMFVFALLRTGIQTAQSVKEKKEREEELAGKIPEDVLKKQEKQKEELKSFSSEVKHYDEIISKKVQALNQFSKKIQSHQKTIEKVLKEQIRNESIIAKMKEQLEFKSSSIKKKNLEITQLNREITKSKDIIKKEEHRKHEILDKIKKLETSLMSHKSSSLERKVKDQKIIKSLNQEIIKIKDDLRTSKNKIKENNMQISTRENEIKSIQDKNTHLANKLQSSNQENNKLDQLLSKLNKEITELKSDKSSLQSKLQNLTKSKNNIEVKANRFQKEIGSLSKESKDKGEALKKQSGEIASLKSQIEKMRGKFNGLDKKYQNALSENSKLSGKNQELSNQLGSLKKELAGLNQGNKKAEGKIASLSGQLQELKNKNHSFQKRVKNIGRNIASAKSSLRSIIGQKLSKRFAKHKLDVKVDPKSGSLILQMDDSFLFERNDFKLSDIAKTSLQKIIPIYAEEVFGDSKLREQITQIHIIGHASPRYKNSFKDPENIDDIEAYNYNLELSSNRAKEIVKHIFSENFLAFPYKAELRKRIGAMGKSYSEPVFRIPATSEEDLCGSFDCKLSRRVEISFTLKDRSEEIQQALEILKRVEE